MCEQTGGIVVDGPRAGAHRDHTDARLRAHFNVVRGGELSEPLAACRVNGLLELQDGIQLRKLEEITLIVAVIRKE